MFKISIIITPAGASAMTEPIAITQAASVMLSIVDFFIGLQARDMVNTGHFRGPSVPPGFTEYENH